MFTLIPIIASAFVGADIATDGESTTKITDRVESAIEILIDGPQEKPEVIDLSTSRWSIIVTLLVIDIALQVVLNLT